MFTLEKKIEIANAVNTALLKGNVVKVDGQPIEGILINDGDVACIIKQKEQSGGWTPFGHYTGEITFFHLDGTEHIVTVKSIEIDIDVIYEAPPRAATKSAMLE